MSEFKYACPVCGQHIKCDSSQAGTVMDCPTCFQKIVVPQAPADADPKFILTGTKYVEKKAPDTSVVAAGPQAAKSGVAAVVIFLVALLLAGGAGLYFFGGKFIHRANHWDTGDVGNVGAPGSSTQANGTWTVAGDGADVWGESDAFHFVHRALNGDCTVTVHVTDQQNTDPWAKAGLMVRDSLDADSPYAFVFVTPVSGVQFQQRTATGAAASPVSGAAGKAPCWLRLTRQGDTFRAQTSPDGTAWSPMNATTIAMEDPVYVGMAVCSHNNGTLSRATFDNLALSTGAGTPSASDSGPVPPPASKPEPPKPVAPLANDANWMLELGSNAIPNAPVAGRIHGQDFIIERAAFQNGTLTLREGNRGNVDFGVTINFEGAQAGSLSGKTITVNSNAEKAARITLRWRDNSQAVKASFDNGYALRLEFGPLGNNRLPGKIYLCTPDAEKSYLMGTFTATLPKPKPQASAGP